MAEIQKITSQAINFLEQDNRGVQLGCYSVALIGLSVALRRVRPFSKFRKPSDVPNRFITEGRELIGVVKRIEPNGALLMINHEPLVKIPGLPDGELPVKISGVRVSGLGLSWLQTIVAGNQIKFIPIAKGKDYVHCQVLMPQIKNNKEQILNVGESLVKIGFGQVVDNKRLSKRQDYVTYCNRLEAAENYALRKKLGVKYYIKPTLSAVAVLGSNFKWAILSMYRQIVQIPKMPAS